ncbi:hypothetical protein V8D89_001330 [Ganoderma adspersum]
MDASFSAQCTRPQARQVPVEVSENIIDMLYSGDVAEELKNFAALRSCALVCRDWSIRAQIRLFHFVHLPDVHSLYRFAAILQAKRYLGTFVHEVSLIGHALHTTASTLSLFPVVFAGKLPNLEELYVQHISESETWYPKTTPAPEPVPVDQVARKGPKSLPYIPLHPRFPTFLSALGTITTLALDNITFRSFGEFARLVLSLPNLLTLRCNSVQWTTIGPVPAFMDPERTEEVVGLSLFAPNLQGLVFLNSSIYGAERLISACGPTLRRLDISIPLVDGPEVFSRGSGIDLSSCYELRDLYVVPTPEFSKTDQHDGANPLESMLASWDTRQPFPTLTIGAYYQSCNFTRQEFADLLHALGAVTERWVQAIQAVDGVDDSGEGECCRVQYWVDIVIYDWESHSEWWWDHVTASFPAWVRLGRLEMDYYTPPAPNYEWCSKPASEDGSSNKPTS